jgi:hypothetical protein
MATTPTSNSSNSSVKRSSLTAPLASRYYSSNIRETKSPSAVTITNKFAKGFIMKNPIEQTDFILTQSSVFVKGLDTTKYK